MEAAIDCEVPQDMAFLHMHVAVRYGHGSDPARFDEVWTVQWSPQGGGPYPDFDGELAVVMHEGHAVLQLTGSYVPPLGAAGAAFDRVAGSRIAAVTARSFLSSIASELEQACARESGS